MAFFKSNDHDPDLAAKVGTVQDSRKLVETLTERVGILASDVAKGEAKASAAALAIETGTGNAKAYETIATDLERKKDELSRKRRALEAAKQKLTADEAALHVAGTANRERDAKKLAGQRAKAAADIATAIDQLYAGWSKLHAVNQKLVAWSPTIALNHGGCLLSVSEVVSAVVTEITRVSSPGILAGAGVVPALPGSRVNPLENPSTQPPLASVIEMANTEMIKRIVNGALAVDHSEPADPDEQLLQQSAAPAAQPGPVFNADQIMALMPAARELKI